MWWFTSSLCVDITATSDAVFQYKKSSFAGAFFLFASVSVAALALSRSEGFAFFAVEAAIHVLITAAKIRFFLFYAVSFHFFVQFW